MPALNFFIVCEDVSADQFKGSISCFNIFEVIRTPSFPVIVPFVSAVSMWEKTEADEGVDYQCVLKVTLPDEEASKDFSVNFTMTTSRHRINQRLQAIPLDREGEIKMELFLNGSPINTYSIPVILDESADAMNILEIGSASN